MVRCTPKSRSMPLPAGDALQRAMQEAGDREAIAEYRANADAWARLGGEVDYGGCVGAVRGDAPFATQV